MTRWGEPHAAGTHEAELGESWLTAAIPIENPTAAVSTHEAELGEEGVGEQDGEEQPDGPAVLAAAKPEPGGVSTLLLEWLRSAGQPPGSGTPTGRSGGRR